MAKYSKELTEEILEFVREHGVNYREWYVGISKEPEKDLFKRHNVQKNGDLWMYDLATDNNNAREVEERLLMLGFDGAALNSDPKATAVYVYRKKGHTKEW